jgi:hypothetical protein
VAGAGCVVEVVAAVTGAAVVAGPEAETAGGGVAATVVGVVLGTVVGAGAVVVDAVTTAVVGAVAGEDEWGAGGRLWELATAATVPPRALSTTSTAIPPNTIRRLMDSMVGASPQPGLNSLATLHRVTYRDTHRVTHGVTYGVTPPHPASRVTRPGPAWPAPGRFPGASLHSCAARRRTEGETWTRTHWKPSGR